MTQDQWQISADPRDMIGWMSGRSDAVEGLWQFTSACLRRVYDDLPGEAFRRVVRHFETVGVSDLDDLLDECERRIGKLKQRARSCDDEGELNKISRKIGYGSMVFALQFQAPDEAAIEISSRLTDWAEDPNSEKQLQADLLRTHYKFG